MNYPAIKDGDKVSFTYFERMEEKTSNTTVRVVVNGQMYLDTSDKTIFIGFQDNPQLMENGITNFRIHERADGTPVFMEGDVIDNESIEEERKVLSVNNDVCILSTEANEYAAIVWTFQELRRHGWKLKEPTKEESSDEKIFQNFDVDKHLFTPENLRELVGKKIEGINSWSVKVDGITYVLRDPVEPETITKGGNQNLTVSYLAGYEKGKDETKEEVRKVLEETHRDLECWAQPVHLEVLAEIAEKLGIDLTTNEDE
jgi:hypothetical protein